MGLEAGTILLSLTGLSLLTWNIGWTLSDLGRRKRTDTGLIHLDTVNGPTNLGASFLEATFRGKSLVDNHTF